MLPVYQIAKLPLPELGEVIVVLVFDKEIVVSFIICQHLVIILTWYSAISDFKMTV